MTSTTLQYVGARYVPIFGRVGESSIEWDNSAPYEPLTIVLYQGNSYTSRQFVPADIEITDTRYWALTGNYNGQIETLRQQVQQNAAKILNLEEDVSDIKTDLVSIHSDIDDLTDNKIDKSSIENSLTSDDQTKVLSANQGKVLKGLIDTTNSDVVALTGRVSTAETNITGLQSDVGDIETRINNVEKRALLWINSSPSSVFTSQTIDLDLANYNSLLIITKENNSSNTYFPFFIQKSVAGVLTRTLIASSTPQFLETVQRLFSSSNLGVTFNNAYYGHSGGFAQADQWMLPYKIYGIKEI